MNKFSMLLQLILMLACMVFGIAASAFSKFDETNCTVRVYQGSVFFKISSSDPKDIINIQANGKWVADYNTEAVLRDEDDKKYFHVSLTPSGACVFIIYNFDGNIFSVSITSATSTLTEVSIQGIPITSCFSPSLVALNLKGKVECHQKKPGTMTDDGLPVWVIVLLVLQFVAILICIAIVAIVVYKGKEGKDIKSCTEDGLRKNKQQQPFLTETNPKTQHSSSPTRKRINHRKR
ncbi:uncharacterized protein LOC128239249 isoform X2 [Mya arenaria]|uniref:uncharacterized protein LOC128239249 isoform X2 n=1 Tax=Mya arenaria TaxID=6604 RepID=UPI0022E2EE67|nr:uncharacterized protein LOC128239249 isoform X2 [Mya arenaria]XP_052811770.1 uncharacterized protein LOC128239249 isoform X2 [Mya arenaria]XP_052811771.1 uncharacterized protein LOC128239249 isoform X2 [Mya arenaria]